MPLLLHRLLDRLKQAVPPNQWRRVVKTLRELVGLRPPLLVLPRGLAHWMKLDVRGVPARFIQSSLRLQLRQLLGDGKFGFAYAVHGETVTLWHWNEVDEGEFASLLRGRFGNLAPWPESLLRAPLADGVHLLACQNGFEALCVVAQEAVRTRWFAVLPTPDAWAVFVRDAGHNPEQCPLPSPSEVGLQHRPPRGWKLSTNLIQPVPTSVLLAAATVAAVGLLIVIGGSYSLKLDRAIASERVAYEKLERENAATIALQQKINQKIEYLNGFKGARPPITQLDLMKALLESGLATEKTGVSVAEWEYRSGRLRLLFSVPPEDFRLGLFLSILEGQPVLQDIKLMPDTPPLTVGIQAAIVAPPSPAAEEHPPAAPAHN